MGSAMEVERSGEQVRLTIFADESPELHRHLLSGLPAGRWARRAALIRLLEAGLAVAEGRHATPAQVPSNRGEGEATRRPAGDGRQGVQVQDAAEPKRGGVVVSDEGLRCEVVVPDQLEAIDASDLADLFGSAGA